MYSLYEYGIQTEGSTHRIHVDVVGKRIFIYKTSCGIAALPEPIIPVYEYDWEKNGYYLVKPSWSNRQPTARGIRLPYKNIVDCVSVRIPDNLLGGDDTRNYSTSQKGNMAANIIIDMMERGYVPFAITVQNIDDKCDQIKGIDLQTTNFLIQVKFDMGCCERGLFIQTHERNIYNAH